ncbi:hypothetical protein BDK51DRAFT_25914 [Blyttiomyces helicus]|uniref:Uncharacterized protein n=1 Tax=Blyttiomyces helicus TaxID=388810 RepID=A0A4V1IRJ9_9FUNG|nr:hypothetical protein BDK51DRAFT_25914 [Blyttiomyces helicus]|eukprot:RKO90317.1 hypothetical protein BDK51DRAFT_25914 [Blyttiomyces helicus]
MGGKLVFGLLAVGFFSRFGVYSAPATTNDHQHGIVTAGIKFPGFQAVVPTIPTKKTTTTTPAYGPIPPAATAKKTTTTTAVYGPIPSAAKKTITTTPAYGPIPSAAKKTTTTTPAYGPIPSAPKKTTTTTPVYGTIPSAPKKTTTTTPVYGPIPSAAKKTTTTTPAYGQIASTTSAPDQEVYVQYQHFIGYCSENGDVNKYNVPANTCTGDEPNCGDTKSCYKFNINSGTVQYDSNCNSDCSSCGHRSPTWLDNQCYPDGVKDGDFVLASYAIPTKNYINNAPGMEFTINIYTDNNCQDLASGGVSTFTAGTCGYSSFSQWNTDGSRFLIKMGYLPTQSTLMYDDSTKSITLFSGCNSDCSYCSNMWMTVAGYCSVDGLPPGLSFWSVYVSDPLLIFSNICFWKGIEKSIRRL